MEKPIQYCLKFTKFQGRTTTMFVKASNPCRAFIKAVRILKKDAYYKKPDKYTIQECTN